MLAAFLGDPAAVLLYRAVMNADVGSPGLDEGGFAGDSAESVARSRFQRCGEMWPAEESSCRGSAQRVGRECRAGGVC